jgi:hypothetical protein
MSETLPEDMGTRAQEFRLDQVSMAGLMLPLSSSAVGSRDQFDITHTPALVEPGFKRAVEAEEHVQPLP